MRIAPFLIVLGITGIATPAMAWDFSCYPPETKDLTEQTPNVMLMLDRSGSMSDSGGTLPNTCKVCENSGGYFEVPDAGSCPAGGTAWSDSDTSTLASPTGDFFHSFTLTTGVAAHDFDLVVEVNADIGGSCEWMDVFADGTWVGEMRGGGSFCSNQTRTFTVPQSAADDGSVDIVVQAYGDGNNCNGTTGGGNCAADMPSTCDGVDDCGSGNGGDWATVTINHEVLTYHGTQTWLDPCDDSNKWEQAKFAIDALTMESDAAIPPYANFGLGWYNGSSASIQVDCASPNNGPIMSALTASPSSSTPTAAGIIEAYGSNCVVPGPTTTRTQSTAVPSTNAQDGFDVGFTFTGVPSEAIVIDVAANADIGSPCEIGAIYVDGDYFGYLGATGGGGCESDSFQFTVPPAYAADGQLDVVVDMRHDGDTTNLPLPVCNPGDAGVSGATCGSNSVSVSITHTNASPAPGATILINDGQPTRPGSCGSGGTIATCQESYEAALDAACTHRALAPLFIVGLGFGTDYDFNNVLAAAGGTGSCAGDVDPCSLDWADVVALVGAVATDGDGDCTGAIQADNRDQLLLALDAIVQELVCTFNINFFDSGYTAVPPDPTNDYDYLYVEVYDTDAGGPVQIMHKDAATATPAGEGWDFTSDARAFIQFTDHYCDNVRDYQYSQGSTHLACLCQEVPGEVCSVPNNVALGICPEGVWDCTEGIDTCVPDTDCCEPGVPCDTGLLGVCAEGIIDCSGPPLGVCVPINTPMSEICDLLDNDCDGETDEDLGGDECFFPGGVGRCGDGIEECINGELSCIPLTAMPELCNGLDDDCDNEIDNISESWNKMTAPFPAIKASLDNDGKAAACNFNDVCMCPSGVTAEHAGTTFDEYLTAYAPPVCECGEGLAPADGPMSVGEPSSPNSGTSGGCSTVSTRSDGMLPLLLLGLLGLRRRR